jgi:hypothetical protein
MRLVPWLANMRSLELTENLQVITLKAECLIHVLCCQQSTWCGTTLESGEFVVDGEQDQQGEV